MGLCHSSGRMKDKSMWEKVIYLRYYSKQQDNKLNIMLFRFEIMAVARCLGACAGGGPDQLWGALPCDVTTWGVPLDDAEDQTHGWAVGQCHPLTGCQAEPCQASEEEGGHNTQYIVVHWIQRASEILSQSGRDRLLAASGWHFVDILVAKSAAHHRSLHIYSCLASLCCVARLWLHQSIFFFFFIKDQLDTEFRILNELFLIR